MKKTSFKCVPSPLRNELFATINHVQYLKYTKNVSPYAFMFKKPKILILQYASYPGYSNINHAYSFRPIMVSTSSVKREIKKINELPNVPAPVSIAKRQ